MGLDIHIDLANRKELEEVSAKNKAISERNDKAYQEHGEKAQYEQVIELNPKNSFYFRKFNALVEWVANNVGNVENCEPIELTRTHIELLQNTLNNLTPENCKLKFPTCSGFFFGSQEYDRWYWEDVESAKEMCEEILETADWDQDVVKFLIWY